MFTISNYFHFDYPIFYCRTWLLAPELIELLPSNSHILQFQSLFQIVRSYKDPFRQAEERVFGSILDDVSMYPEKTTLQRNLKQCLLQGGCSYKGVGIWQVQEKQKGQEE